MISIHVPSWGTTDPLSVYTGIDAFQSTFPRGERLTEEGMTKALSIFQSTFPRGERPVAHEVIAGQWGFQSTFPRGERRLHCTKECRVFYFNPRSLVGNDLILTDHSFAVCNFNPRSLVGNDWLTWYTTSRR